MTGSSPLASRNRAAALVTSLAGAVALVVAWVAVGADGPGSALLGVVLVLVFFSAGSLPFVVVGDGSNKGLPMLVLGMTYVLRILLGVAVYAVATQSDAVDRTVVGLTVIGCSLVWTGTHVVLGLSRRRQPTLEV